MKISVCVCFMCGWDEEVMVRKAARQTGYVLSGKVHSFALTVKKKAGRGRKWGVV